MTRKLTAILTCGLCFLLFISKISALCSDPGLAANSLRVPNATQPSFNQSDAIDYQCITPGYDLLSGSLSITCLFDGSWTGSLPNCSLIDCGDPGNPLYGYRTISTTTYGSNVTFYCNSTYEFAPPTDEAEVLVTTTCLANKQWSATLPNCQRKSCGEPPAVVGASVTRTGTLAGDVATYVAQSGYRLSGTLSLTCLNTKVWDPAGNPTSQIVTCDLPSSLSANTEWTVNTSANAIANSQKFPFSSTIEVVCSEGYEIASGNNIRTCQDSGSWSGSALNCKPITCPALSVTNAIVDQPSSAVGAIATCSCSLGYYYSGRGDTTRQCLSNGTWAGDDIVCDPVLCVPVNFTMPINASTSIVRSSFGNGTFSNGSIIWDSNSSLAIVVNAVQSDKVQFECANETRWARGSRVWNCLTDGTWDSSDPIVCKLNIPPPGIGVDPPNGNKQEAENADFLGKVIVIILFSGFVGAAVVDSVSIVRTLSRRMAMLRRSHGKKDA